MRALYRIPENHDFDVEEMSIEAGDDLWVVGTIEAVEKTVSGENRVRVGGVPGEGLRVTNVTPDELARTIKKTPAFTAMGVIWLIAGLASLAYWGRRFFL